MNTKDIATKLFIKTLSTTLACLVASSALALDDRFDDPKPQPEPDGPGKVDKKLPDLVPLALNMKRDLDMIEKENDPDTGAFGWRYFHGIMTIANFGNADCEVFEGKLISCTYSLVGYKVLATTDPVHYPVGYTEYGDYNYLVKLGLMEVVDEDHWLRIPKAVTSVQFFAVVDRVPDWTPTYEGTWVDDFGADYIGKVVESREDNNVIDGPVMHFAELLDPTPSEPVESKPVLKVRGK